MRRTENSENEEEILNEIPQIISDEQVDSILRKINTGHEDEFYDLMKKCKKALTEQRMRCEGDPERIDVLLENIEKIQREMRKRKKN